MSKLKVTTIADVADSESTNVTNVINGSAKAWVNFDGTFGSSPFTVANGGIRAAFNVSSVVDNGTGDYTVNFTNAMSDADYSFVCQGNTASGYFIRGADDYSARTTALFRIAAFNLVGASQDSSIVTVAVFR